MAVSTALKGMALGCVLTTAMSYVGFTLGSASEHVTVAHAAMQEASSPANAGYDSRQLACEMAGDRPCGHMLACWWMDDTMLCGYSDEASTGAYDFAFGEWLAWGWNPDPVTA